MTETRADEVAPEVLSPPTDAQVVHGSQGTRWYTGEERPRYFPIHYQLFHEGNEEFLKLSILNLPQLAEAIDTGEANTVDVHGAPAKGVPLLTNGHLGADMLFVPAGESFPLHVHGGHHFLLCVKGKGSVTFDGKIQVINPGDLYMIEASVPHAVGAAADGPGHWLVAFGAPHAELESEERMEVVT